MNGVILLLVAWMVEWKSRLKENTILILEGQYIWIPKNKGLE